MNSMLGAYLSLAQGNAQCERMGRECHLGLLVKNVGAEWIIS